MKSTGCETTAVCIAQSSAFGKDCKYTSLHGIVTDNNKDVNDDDDHNDNDDKNHDNEDGSYTLSKTICSLLFWIKYTTQTSYPTWGYGVAGFHKILSYLFKNFVCQGKIENLCQFLRLAYVTNIEQSLIFIYLKYRTVIIS